MGKTSTRLKDFFEGKRRKCRLQEAALLVSSEDDRRIKFSIIMPLSNEPYEGTPDVVSEQFAIMAKEKSTVNFAKIDIDFDEANVKIFTTDTVKRAFHSSIGASLQNFRTSASGVDEKRTVDLLFDLRIPGSEEIWTWIYRHKHAEFYLETVPQQRSLDDEEEEDKPEAPSKGAKKPRQQTLM